MMELGGYRDCHNNEVGVYPCDLFWLLACFCMAMCRGMLVF
jgi:hypothetical protein